MKFKCRLEANVFNNNQRGNNDKGRCECKELIDEVMRDKGFSECECDKSYDIVEYLNFKNCKRRKSLIDKVVEECSENFYRN